MKPVTANMDSVKHLIVLRVQESFKQLKSILFEMCEHRAKFRCSRGSGMLLQQSIVVGLYGGKQ